MQHLVVVAHPVQHSLTMALTHAYAAELERLGHRQTTYDLYRMGFDPVLSADELAATGHANPLVAQAQDAIRAADALTVIYPLWWLSMPAIMKGFIDRVFARGFAYDAQAGIVRGLLTGKQAMLITLSGAPLPVLTQSGGWNAVQALQDTQIFRNTGLTLREHVHFDAITPDLSKDRAEHCLTRIRACAQHHFPPSATASVPSEPGRA